MVEEKALPAQQGPTQRKAERERRPSWAVVALLAALYLTVVGFAVWIGIAFLWQNTFVLGSGFLDFQVDEGFMQPTIEPGDHVLVWPNYYQDHRPQYGDIAIFTFEDEPGMVYLARIVGLPDDLMQMVQGVLHINGAAVKRERVGERSSIHPEDPDLSVAVTEYVEYLPNGTSHRIWEEADPSLFEKPSLDLVPEGQVLVVDDYRDNWLGNQSANVGVLVPVDRLHHRAEAILWSNDFSRIGLRLRNEK